MLHYDKDQQVLYGGLQVTQLTSVLQLKKCEW